MASMRPIEQPPTPLGRMRILSPTCSLRVSPLCLGNMSLGNAWARDGPSMGDITKEEVFAMYDAFVAAGGNFIDTANNYQEEQSELWLGEWLEQTGKRDELVIASKYTTMYRGAASNKVQYQGNGYKSMHLSIDASLRKLKTSYLDILYLHWWDYNTSIPEVMQSLNVLVRERKVLHLGISDTPAWIIAACNMYAQQHGLAPFVLYQGKFSLLERSAERDLLPCLQHFGMAFCSWGSMGQGRFLTKEDLEARKAANDRHRLSSRPISDVEEKVAHVLQNVGKDIGQAPTAVALAYVMAKAPRVYPIVGGRKVEHLKQNIQALSIRLTQAQIDQLDQASGVNFDLGHPMSQFGTDPTINGGKECYLVANAAVIDHVPGPKSLTAPTS